MDSEPSTIDKMAYNQKEFCMGLILYLPTSHGSSGLENEKDGVATIFWYLFSLLWYKKYVYTNQRVGAFVDQCHHNAINHHRCRCFQLLSNDTPPCMHPLQTKRTAHSYRTDRHSSEAALTCINDRCLLHALNG